MKKEGKFVPCDQCGEQLWRKPYRLKRSERAFCDRVCKKTFQSQSVITQCNHCKTSLLRKPSSISISGKSYCDSDCYKEFAKGEQSGHFKHGKKIHEGYIQLRVSCLSPEFQDLARQMTPGSVITEHRLVLAQKLDRPLLIDEIVHHLDKDRLNNAPDNLSLMTREDHGRMHRLNTLESRRISSLEGT